MNNGGIANFLGNSSSFKLKQKITGKTRDDGRKDVKIMVPLKYFSNFWRALKMSLINCEINLISTWSANCVISNAAGIQATLFAITDAKLYVPVVTLSTDDNGKLLQQLKTDFKRTINWNKYQLEVTIKAQNRHLDYLNDPSFEGANRLFVLSFLDGTVRTGYRRYFPPNVQIKGYNVMIDGKNFFISCLKVI